MEETKITPVPAQDPAYAPAPAAAPAPATNAPAAGHNSGPIDDQDMNDWKARFNDVLARPGEHVNSQSPGTAQSWHAGFFDCFNPLDTCLITYFLPCVTFGKTHHRLRKNGDLQGWEPINTSCLLLCGSGCCGLGWIPMAMQRQNIREKYNLQGSCLTDIALSCCCHCCSLIQSDKEAELHEQQASAGGVQQAYQSNTEMAYPGK